MVRCYKANLGNDATVNDGGMQKNRANGVGLPTVAFKDAGLSNVIMLGENASKSAPRVACVDWINTGTDCSSATANQKVHTTNAGKANYTSDHPGDLIGVCMADGSTSFLVIGQIVNATPPTGNIQRR